MACVIFENPDGSAGNGAAFYIGCGRSVTAAHVLAGPDTKQRRKNLVVIPGAFGYDSARRGTYTPQKIVVPWSCIKLPGYNTQFDYAYFDVEWTSQTQKALNDLNAMPLYAPYDWQFKDYCNGGNMLTAIGYPDEKHYARHRTKSFGKVLS